ncbi:hypothetical protein SUDANB1_02804 [Streptomyces sp. enrichment culture]
MDGAGFCGDLDTGVGLRPAFYGEDATTGEGTISTRGLPRYEDDGAEEADQGRA